MTKNFDDPCPCCSGKKYLECCGPYHLGAAPQTAEALMRSRYSAYALSNADYIVRTTYSPQPLNPQAAERRKEEILGFSKHTTFEKLEILASKELSEKATVIFIAHLKQGGKEATFTERSSFVKRDGAWLYVRGDVFSGQNRELAL